MKAARVAAPGHPFTLEELPVPRPGPGEVLLRVAACGLCASDLHLAVHPSVPCGSCANCQRGLPNICVDPQVMGYHRQGGYCEYTTVPVAGAIPIPDELSWEQAAIVPDAVTTPARRALRGGEPNYRYRPTPRGNGPRPWVWSHRCGRLRGG